MTRRRNNAVFFGFIIFLILGLVVAFLSDYSRVHLSNEDEQEQSQHNSLVIREKNIPNQKTSTSDGLQKSSKDSINKINEPTKEVIKNEEEESFFKEDNGIRKKNILDRIRHGAQI